MSVSVYLSEEKIQQRVTELGEEISKAYAGEDLTVVCILNGSFMFTADLVRKIKLPQNIECISVSSYEGTESTGTISMNLDLKNSIENKNVLVVEDIVDTGRTMKYLMEHLKTKNPKSLKLASFLFKKARLVEDVAIDYLGFEIDDHFVIGYGLDFNGKYRELPYVGIYEG